MYRPEILGTLPKSPSIKNANLTYIRAAILERTGIKLSVQEVARYLVEEGLLTERKAKSLIFDNYNHLYKTIGYERKDLEVIKPVDIILSETDLSDVEENEYE